MANRIRTIKPEILEDEKTAFLSHLEYRLFTGAWIVADDYGNLRGDPDYIRCQIVWASKETRDTVAEALAELERAELVRRYTVRGQTYYHILNFHKHQRIDKPGKPKCPGPDQDDGSGSAADNRSRNDSSNDSRMPREQVALGLGLGLGLGSGIREREVEGEREPARSPPAPRGRRAPSGDHQRVIDSFETRYTERNGRGASWGATQGNMVKQLLAKHPADEVIRRIGILFDSPPLFLANCSPDLGTLVQHFDKLVAPANLANGTRAGPHPNAPRNPVLSNLLDDIARREAAGET